MTKAACPAAVGDRGKQEENDFAARVAPRKTSHQELSGDHISKPCFQFYTSPNAFEKGSFKTWGLGIPFIVCVGSQLDFEFLLCA